MRIILRSPGAPPPIGGPILLLPISLIVIGCWGTLASWEVTIFGKNLAAPLSSLLTAAFGPEGVKPGLDLAEKVFFGVIAVGIFWLLALRRTLWTDPELGKFMQVWKGRFEVSLIFAFFLFMTVVAAVGIIFDVPGSWLDENLGPSVFGLLELGLFAGVTLLSGLYWVHLNRKVREHPFYSKRAEATEEKP